MPKSWALTARQFYALIWKDFVVHKRHFVWTSLEITIPVLVCALAILSNSHQGKPKLENERTFDADDYDRLYGDLNPQRHRLLVAPNSSFTRALVDHIDDGAMTVVLCNSEQELVEEIRKEIPVSLDQIKKLLPSEDNANITVAGVVVQSDEQLNRLARPNGGPLYYDVISKLDGQRMKIPINFDISIRAKEFRLGAEPFPKKSNLAPFLHADHYATTFFMATQIMLSRAYMNLLANYLKGNSSQAQPQAEANIVIPTNDDIIGQRLPYPKYVAHRRLKDSTLSTFVAGSQKQKPFVLTMDYCITVGFLLTAIFLAKRVVDERKSRVRDMLRLVGISDWNYYGSLMTNTLLIMTAQCSLITLLFTGHANAPSQNTDSTLLFTILMLYCSSAILFVLALSSCFKSSTKAIIFTSLVWLGTPEVIDRVFKLNSGIAESNGFISAEEPYHLLFALLPNYGLRLMTRILNECDIYGEFFNKKQLYGEYRAIWPNIFHLLPLYKTLTVANVMLAFAASIPLYIGLIYLVNNVLNDSSGGLSSLGSSSEGGSASSKGGLLHVISWLVYFVSSLILAPIKLVYQLLFGVGERDERQRAQRATGMSFIEPSLNPQLAKHMKQQQYGAEGYLNSAFTSSVNQSLDQLDSWTPSDKQAPPAKNINNKLPVHLELGSLKTSETFLNPTILEGAQEQEQQQSQYFERVPRMLTAGVSIKNLCKTYYTTGSKVKRIEAVKNVSLDMYYSQILVLLGHNGAGKTTLIDIISGHSQKTSGTVYINGYNIDTEPTEARRQVGFCPQFDVLFERLTVDEHLYFYGIVKNGGSELAEEIERLLEQSGLDAHRRKLSKNLSGGYKRKLSLAIAMIADSTVLILDEPTSGMDPESRRKVWDFLQLIRRDRLILMTTHHMEEADALGDRVAVMSKGQVKCAGSPLFLKRVFDAGYHLRISKSSNWSQETFERLIGHKFDLQSKLENSTPHELMYKFEAHETNDLLVKLFEELERVKDQVGIFGFGMTVSTMDDVFMRIGLHFKDAEAQENKSGPADGAKLKGEPACGAKNLVFAGQRLEGRSLFRQQLQALIGKRVQHAHKNWLQLLWIMAISLACVAGTALMIELVIFKEQVTPDWSRDMTLEGAGYAPDSQPVFQLPAEPPAESPEATSPAAAAESSTLGAGSARNRRWTNASVAPRPEQVFLERHWLPQVRKSGSFGQLLNYTDINSQMVDLLTSQFSNFRERYIVGGERSANKYVAWYNGEATHSLPVSMNIMLNSILKQMTDLIPDTSHPLKESRISLKHICLGQINTLIAFLPQLGRLINLVFLPFSLAFITSYFVIFPTHERVTKSKHLQLMTGVSAKTFWLSHFLFDFALYCVYTALVLAIYFVWDRVINERGLYFVNAQHTVALVSLVGLFVFSALPLAYIFSFLAKKPTSAFSSFCVLTILTGTATLTLVSLYELKYETGASAAVQAAFACFLWCARLIPSVSLLVGLQKLFALNTTRYLCASVSPEILQLLCRYIKSPLIDDELRVLRPERCCKQICADECFDQQPFVWRGWFGVNVELLMLLLDACLYWLLLAAIESQPARLAGWLRAPRPLTWLRELAVRARGQRWRVPRFADNRRLQKEQLRVDAIVEARQTGKFALVANRLSKLYSASQVRAVDELSFAVERGEFFGLLGVNGAGKSSTFKMLTGELPATQGQAWLAERELGAQRREYLRRVGYCPQQDALIHSLSGAQMLALFARLRGVPERHVPETVRALLGELGLSAHAHVDCHNYSGGNKRRLSVAMALVGAPQVVFLDEPTSGVDPRSRRRLWATLGEFQRQTGSAVVMTSHSMNECECLCDRVAIMVDGQFKVLGSIQYLRTSLARGFSLLLKLKPDTLAADATPAATGARLLEYLRRAFSQCRLQLRDVHQTVVQCHIEPSKELAWSSMLLLLEQAKRELDLEDYQLDSDASLESIFLSLAKREQL